MVKHTKRGGVSVKKTGIFTTFTRAFALDYFMSKSKFKIFTNNSLTAITILATLNDGVDTPFRSMRSLKLFMDVRKILLKISVTRDTTKQAMPADSMLTIPRRGDYLNNYNGAITKGYGGIQLITLESFNKEVNIQKRIYKKSFSEEKFNSPFDGLCPSVIASLPDIDWLNTLPELCSKIRDNLVERGGQDCYGVNRDLQYDKNELDQVFNYRQIPYVSGNKNNTLSIIAMEYLDGYKTVYDADQEGLFNVTHKHMINYAFKQLHELGYMHMDAHPFNMMINVNEIFFSPDHLGRVIIIDFGRTRQIDQAVDGNNVQLQLRAEGQMFTDPTWPVFTKETYDQMTSFRKQQISILETKLRNLGIIILNQTIWDFMKILLSNNNQEHYYAEYPVSGGKKRYIEDFRKRVLSQLNMNEDVKIKNKRTNKKKKTRKNRKSKLSRKY